jgi:hypothetical protein
VSDTFVIECFTKNGEVYYLDDKGEFDKRLTSPHTKKWKTQRGAEKYLESIKEQ